MSTFIDLGVTFTDADDLPQITDYRSLFMADPSFVGLWKFDDATALTLQNGAISEIKNWKTGGVSMAQATTAARAAVAFDATLNRNVGAFVRANSQYYTASGLTFVPTNAYTMVAVVNFADLSQFNQASGQFSNSPNRAHILGVPNAVQHVWGDRNASAPASQQSWVRVIASYDGSMVPKIKVGSTLNTPAAATTAPSASTINALQLGGQFLPFGGSYDLMAFFTSDLLSPAKASMLATVEEYLTRRGV